MEYIRKVKENKDGTYDLIYIDIDPNELKQVATKERIERLKKKLEKGVKVKLKNIRIDENEEVYLPEDMPNRIKAEAKDKIIRMHHKGEKKFKLNKK